MKLDINLSKQASSYNLPDQAKNQMLSNLNNVAATNVYDRTPNGLGRVDDYIVVLSHVESIDLLDFLARYIQDTLIDGIGDAVVDQLC